MSNHQIESLKEVSRLAVSYLVKDLQLSFRPSYHNTPQSID